MTAQEFMKNLVGYYGEYPRPLLKAEVVNTIKNMKPGYLDLLYQELKNTFSTQYKTQPDIVAINKARDKADEYWKEPAIQQPAITDERDYSEEIRGMFAKLYSKIGWLK